MFYLQWLYELRLTIGTPLFEKLMKNIPKFIEAILNIFQKEIKEKVSVWFFDFQFILNFDDLYFCLF